MKSEWLEGDSTYPVAVLGGERRLDDIHFHQRCMWVSTSDHHRPWNIKTYKFMILTEFPQNFFHLIRKLSLNSLTSIILIDIFQFSILLGTSSIATFEQIVERAIVLQVTFMCNNRHMNFFAVDFALLLVLILMMLLSQRCGDKRANEKY